MIAAIAVVLLAAFCYVAGGIDREMREESRRG